MTRTVTVRDDGAVPPSIVVPRGRSAAERRLQSIAALHQPVARMHRDQIGRRDLDEVYYVCGECLRQDRIEARPARWPCTTARLIGPWPGETPDDA